MFATKIYTPKRCLLVIWAKGLINPSTSFHGRIAYRCKGEYVYYLDRFQSEEYNFHIRLGRITDRIVKKDFLITYSYLSRCGEYWRFHLHRCDDIRISISGTRSCSIPYNKAYAELLCPVICSPEEARQELFKS